MLLLLFDDDDDNELSTNTLWPGEFHTNKTCSIDFCYLISNMQSSISMCTTIVFQAINVQSNATVQCAQTS